MNLSFYLDLVSFPGSSVNLSHCWAVHCRQALCEVSPSLDFQTVPLFFQQLPFTSLHTVSHRVGFCVWNSSGYSGWTTFNCSCRGVGWMDASWGMDTFSE